MTKLEEVAEAINRASGDDLGPFQALQVARAAVEAMREPTQAQYDALSASDTLWRNLTSTKVWMAYIDAILNEKPGA